MRYDFPNVDIAIRRAKIRAKQRGRIFYIRKTELGFTLSATEPNVAREFLRIEPAGMITRFIRNDSGKPVEAESATSWKTR
jgi:hypothetical protein